jgi:hypothetical protein
MVLACQDLALIRTRTSRQTLMKTLADAARVCTIHLQVLCISDSRQGLRCEVFHSEFMSGEQKSV